jgi:Domain of unknown function (DUF4342)
MPSTISNEAEAAAVYADTGVMMSERTYTESFKVAADQLLAAVEKLLHEGNVRRVIIKQHGRTVVEFPLTVGLVGAVLAPILAAVGALAAVLTDCSIEVERAMPDDTSKVA